MDSFFGIGIGELFFIAIIALIVLGPERLPGAIREVSKWMRTIRNLSSELTSQFSEEMKAFDDINPTKILRELTEEPTEQINKATGAAKPATKPPAKPATTPAKPATPKPETGAKPAATTTPAAKTGSGLTVSTNITPPAPKKPAQPSGAAQPETDAAKTGAAKTETDAAAPGEPENRILPSVDGAAERATDSPAAPQSGADLGPGEPPGAVQDEKPQDEKPQQEKIVVDAAPRPAVTVNGTSAAEGDA
ncbi:MAG: twin-arginine translocase subunit TatB [Chloroflexi bacterium]|nr:MAG: twin-arginine translocase subunit TatB [Chloroflexota bacterium]